MSIPVRRSFTKHVSLHIDKDAELIAFMERFNFSGKTKELWLKAMEEEKGTAIPSPQPSLKKVVTDNRIIVTDESTGEVISNKPRQQTEIKVEFNNKEVDEWTVE